MADWTVLLRPVGWVAKWWYLLRDRRGDVLAAVALIADEFALNAEVCEAAHHDGAVNAELRDRLRFDAWERHSVRAHRISQKHPDVWDEMRGTHAALFRTQRQGAMPPRKEFVMALAKKLHALDY